MFARSLALSSDQKFGNSRTNLFDDLLSRDGGDDLDDHFHGFEGPYEKSGTVLWLLLWLFEQYKVGVAVLPRNHPHVVKVWKKAANAIFSIEYAQRH